MDRIILNSNVVQKKVVEWWKLWSGVLTPVGIERRRLIVVIAGKHVSPR